jgi:hypothetical protein
VRFCMGAHAHKTQDAAIPGNAYGGMVVGSLPQTLRARVASTQSGQLPSQATGIAYQTAEVLANMRTMGAKRFA